MYNKLFLILALISLSTFIFADYEELDAVSDGGSLKGNVTYRGESSTDVFTVTKDKNVCCASSEKEAGAKQNYRLQVKDGKVKNAVIILEGVSKGKKWEKQDRTVDQVNCAYDPFIQYVEIGKKVKLTNSDDTTHTVHIYYGYHNDNDYGNTGTPAPIFGKKKSLKSKKLDKEGVYSLLCDSGHSWMTGYIYASEHPYVAISDADGNFDISDVPAGTYKVKMWHAGWKIVEKNEKDGIVTSYKFSEPVVVTKEVTITAGGTATLDFELKE